MTYRIAIKHEMKVLQAVGFRSDGINNGSIGLKLDYDDGNKRKQIVVIFDANSFSEIRDMYVFLERAKTLLPENRQKYLEDEVNEILRGGEL